MLLGWLATLSAISPARAQEPSKLECIEANERAQRLKREGQLEQARAALRVSLGASCPAPVREDSTQLMAAIDKQQATENEAERAKTEEARKQAEAEALRELETKMREQSDAFGCELARKTGSAAGWRIYRDAFPSGACAAEAARRTVELQATSAPAPSVPAARPTPDSVAPASAGLSPRRIAGIAVGSAGVVGLAIGTGFGVVAIGKKNDADPHCRDGNKCDSDGVRLREEGLTASYVSTGMLLGGAALGAVGIVLIAISPSKAATPFTAGPAGSSTAKAATALRLAPAPGGALLEGTW